MKVNVTFEFGSTAEAIHFLGKNMEGGPVQAVVMEKERKDPKAPDAPKAEGEKRGRGRPAEPGSRRAKRKNEGGAGSPSAGGAASVAAPAPQMPAASTTTEAPAKSPATEPAQATPAPEASVPTNEQVIDAMQQVLDLKGIDAVMAILARQGVRKASELKDDDRAAFIDLCLATAAGNVDPRAGA